METRSRAEVGALSPLFCDRYEYTMLDAALRSGAGQRTAVFEAFTRRLPEGRRYGVLAGTGRILEALEAFRFDGATLSWLDDEHVVSAATLEWLDNFGFTGHVDGYAEGELFFPGSPVLTVTAPFAAGTLLETLILSILNYDSAVASAAARMRVAAGDRTLIEMGGRRANEHAAVAAARAAYIAGFDATSNLEAGRRWGVPTTGTAAHAFTLVHSAVVVQGHNQAAERAAFAAQIEALGPDTTLLVDTYDINCGIANAIAAARAAGAQAPGAIRIDSGDLHEVVPAARAQLDAAGATTTRIVATGDMDEHTIAATRELQIDAYGAGTAVVTGSGSPTCGFVYKLVAVEHDSGALIGVAKKSTGKASVPGVKRAWRRIDSDGYASDELLSPRFTPLSAEVGHRITTDTPDARGLQHRYITSGETAWTPGIGEARQRCRDSLAELRPIHLNLTAGRPAIA